MSTRTAPKKGARCKGPFSTRDIIVNFRGDIKCDPVIPLLEEPDKRTNGETHMLRLCGGKGYENEIPKTTNWRERNQELGVHQGDLDTPSIPVYVRKGKKYDVHVFVSGVWNMEKELVPQEEGIKAVHWVKLSKILSKGEKYRGPGGLRLQPSHLEHLREFAKTNLLRRVRELCMEKELKRYAAE